MRNDIQIVTALPFEVERTSNTWITLADGTRLAARIWRPVTDEPVPAVFEYLPYRKGDLMAGRDEPLGTWFAGHGYAWVRVDIRGTGDSDGIITDEYTPQEHDDGLETIAWIASQPWCTGAVGMIGISWGGFNGLQIAARRPPALKAIISMCSTDDRYADDVHYDGGCVLNWDALPWASNMLVMDGLPPDPRVRDDWRETWMRRLEETPPFITEWLTHQRRDAFWKHGSVCEDHGAIEAAVYMVGGWADGYTNAIGRTLAGLPGPKKGLIGPWPHSWPHLADQGPRIDFLHEALRWWDRWLKDIDNGIDREPMFAAWLQEPAGPRELHLDRPGRWVREEAWPPPSAEPRRLHLSAGGALHEDAGGSADLSHTGLQHHGLHAGTWCPYGPEADFPPDQREEDALCLSFDTAPLLDRLELLGHPRLHLRVAADRPNAFVAARLCDVAADGTSTLLSRGALNLTHRDSHEHLAPIEPGVAYDVDIELDVLGQAVPAGHRLRLALSTTYWPWLWPSPEVTTITVSAGERSWLDLPVRPLDVPDGEPPAFGPPESAASSATEVLRADPAFHRIEHDVVEDTYVMRLNQDGDNAIRREGVLIRDEARDEMFIREGDPLSARAVCDRVYGLGWEESGIEVEIRTRSVMTSDATHFHLEDRLEAFEGQTRVFERTWERSIPRDHV
ncbi:MAG: CocE/NonD family hydrolase [Actinomycetota bacterium]